jgi:hypothetical protein
VLGLLKAQCGCRADGDALSKVIASVVGALSKRQIGDSVDIADPAEALLKSLVGDAPNTSRAILAKLVEFVQAFGYSGICILVDKVDETPTTANSADATAKLVYPLLSHIQLLEVPGFSWIFFLWSNVKTLFESKYRVRLDKIAHANITWNSDSLRELIESRLKFFSEGRLSFSDLFSNDVDVNGAFSRLTDISINSPRELIKLMDTVVREHDARGGDAPQLIDQTSLDIGQDKYAIETIGSWFTNKQLQQVLRLGKTSFVNKDVQSAFKIGNQGARVKIKNWEDAGLVRQSGTMPSELGGKQVYRFVISDARVERIIARKLDEIVGAGVGEEVDTQNADLIANSDLS